MLFKAQPTLRGFLRNSVIASIQLSFPCFVKLSQIAPSLSVFGVANAVVGYGYNFDSYAVKSKGGEGTFRTRGINEQNDIIFGIQGNSRIGLSFTLGKVFGAALLGAGESTFYGSSTNTGGFRQLYAGYDFGDAGKLLAGKNELITSMGGFSSSIFDTESGLNGFGGASTSTRRFQIAYSVAGFTVSISQNEFGSGDTTNKSWQKHIPRISLGYEYNQDGLRAKVAASYAHKNATRATNGTTDGHRDMVLVTAGIKPTFGDAYISALLTYGLNASKVGEAKLATAGLQRGFGVGVTGHTSIDRTNTTDPDNAYTDLQGGDRNTYAAMLEFGYNLTQDLALKVGVGYQYASAYVGNAGVLNLGDEANPNMVGGKYDKLHAYSAFIQLPYKVGGGFSIIPQVGYLGTTKQINIIEDDTRTKINLNTGSVLAELMWLNPH